MMKYAQATLKKKKRDKLYTFFSTIRTAERDAVKKGRKFFFFFLSLSSSGLFKWGFDNVNHFFL